jgi:hypothetical protein
MYHPRGYGGFGVDDAVYLPDGQEAFVTCVFNFSLKHLI